jgi:hypothetical protein
MSCLLFSEEDIKRLVYLISLNLFRNEREHYSSCNTTIIG